MKNSNNLNKLENIAEKEKLEKLRKDVKAKFERKNRAEHPFKYLTACRRNETIGMRMLYSYQEINQSIKLIF